MPNMLASNLEALEKAGYEGLGTLQLPVLVEDEGVHLRRGAMLLCTWKVSKSIQQTITARRLLDRVLCEQCFENASHSWTTLNGLGEYGVIVALNLVEAELVLARKVLGRLRRGQGVRTEDVYSLEHTLRRLEKETEAPAGKPGAEALTEANDRIRAVLAELYPLLRSEAHQKRVQEKVRKAEAKIRNKTGLRFEAEKRYVIVWSHNISSMLTKVPQLATEVVLSHMPLPKEHTVIAAPGEVYEYLWRVTQRREAPWELRMVRPHEAPEDPAILEAALKLWEPGGTGELSSFPNALRAAKLLQE